MPAANPTPEIYPDDAKAGERESSLRAAAISRTRSTTCWRSRESSRGAFDVRAKDINDEMKMAAAEALANLISDDELSEDYIIPAAFDPRVGKAVAEAVAEAARKSGVARI